MLHFQTTNCRYCTLDTNTNKTYGAQLKPGGGSDEAPSCWYRCLDIYVTMSLSLMSLCVAMAHGSAAVLLWWCGAVVVLSSVLLLTDCTCWLQPGVTGPETSGQWSHSGGAAHWPLATQPPAPPLPSGPPCPCQPSVSRVRRWLSPTHLWTRGHWTIVVESRPTSGANGRPAKTFQSIYHHRK